MGDDRHASADLRAAPGTAAPPRGHDREDLRREEARAAAQEDGRIFVGNEMLFEGYTGGGSKDVIGLMATGDVGHMDEEGRLFVQAATTR